LIFFFLSFASNLSVEEEEKKGIHMIQNRMSYNVLAFNENVRKAPVVKTLHW